LSQGRTLPHRAFLTFKILLLKNQMLNPLAYNSSLSRREKVVYKGALQNID
jgi:hypothetical protein